MDSQATRITVVVSGSAPEPTHRTHPIAGHRTVNLIRPRQAPQPTNASASSSAAFEFVLAPVILALFGLWLDKSVLHTWPVLTIVCAVLGLVGASVKIYYGYKYQMAQLAEMGCWAKAPLTTGAAKAGATQDAEVAS
jgi:hypothetical protein